MTSNRSLRLIGLSMAAAMALSVAVESVAFAGSYDLSAGDVTVTAGSTSQTVIHGNNAPVEDSEEIIIFQTAPGATSNTVTLNGNNGSTAQVTISDVDIEANKGEAGVTVNGDAVITVSGDNSVEGGDNAAGIEVGAGDSLVLQGDGSLEANSGAAGSKTGTGAGIGGDVDEDGGSVAITGDVTVTAQGDAFIKSSASGSSSNGSAGIGGGSNGNGGDVVIDGSANVTAIGGGYDPSAQYDGSYSAGGAGIGAGGGGTDGGSVTIGGDAVVVADGGYNAAGIGGASTGKVESAGGDVVITDNADVTAKGGYCGAGVGGGARADGGTVTLSGNAILNASGGGLAAGVGGGGGGYYGSSIVNGVRNVNGGDGGVVTLLGGVLNALGGAGAAGVGGGAGAEAAQLGNKLLRGLGGLGAQLTINGGIADITGGIGAVGVGNGSDSVVTGTAKNPDPVVWVFDSSADAGTLTVNGGSGVVTAGSVNLPAVAASGSNLVLGISAGRFTVANVQADALTPGVFSWSALPLPVPVVDTDPGTPVAPVTNTVPTVAIADAGVPLAGVASQSAAAQGELTNVDDLSVPLASPAGSSWALLNLILAVAAVVLSAVMLLGGGKRMRFASLLPAAGAVAAFLLTEKIAGTMVMTDSWTLLMAAIALIQTGLLLFCGRKNATVED